MRKWGFATYIALTFLVLLISLVFMATVAGSYAVNIVSSILARGKEAKILARIHNIDALRSLPYFDYRIASLDRRTTPGPVSVPGGGYALTYLCRNKPPYLAYSWFYEPRMRPPSAQAGLSDCPLLLANDYVGQELPASLPTVERSTYSIYYSTTALITAIAPHLSNGGPPLLEYVFTPILVKSVWSSPDPHYLLPFSPLYAPVLSEGSIIDAPGILVPDIAASAEFGVFRSDGGADTSASPATFIAPIGVPELGPPTSPSNFTSLRCPTAACDSLGYAYSPTSPGLSLNTPHLYRTAPVRGASGPPHQVLLPPQIYLSLNQVSLTNRSVPPNPFVGGFSYNIAPSVQRTDYFDALTRAIYSTYYQELRATRSFDSTQGEFTVHLGVDENDNDKQVVRVTDSNGQILYEERFPPEGAYTTRVLEFRGVRSYYYPNIHIRLLQGSSFAMNGRVNLDLVIKVTNANGRGSVALWDDLTMKNHSCDSTPTWRQGVPIPAFCPRKQLMLLHLVSDYLYFSDVKNRILDGVVLVGTYGFAYPPSALPPRQKIDIHMVGAWFGGRPIHMVGAWFEGWPIINGPSSFSVPRLFFTAPELGRTQRIWPKLRYPLHVNALQVLEGNLFSR